jgi:hypothetical protein
MKPLHGGLQRSPTKCHGLRESLIERLCPDREGLARVFIVRGQSGLFRFDGGESRAAFFEAVRAAGVGAGE